MANPEFGFRMIGVSDTSNHQSPIVRVHMPDPNNLSPFIGQFIGRVNAPRDSTTPIYLEGLGVFDISTAVLGHMAVYFSDPNSMGRLVCHDFGRDFLLKRDPHHKSDMNATPMVDTPMPIDIRQRPPRMNDVIGMPRKTDYRRGVHTSIVATKPVPGVAQLLVSKLSTSQAIVVHNWQQIHDMLPEMSDNTYTRIVGYADTGRIIL